jgi:hypothetical protein
MIQRRVSKVKQIKRNKESAQVLMASMITGNIKTTLFWSEHRTQARQTTTPSVAIYCVRCLETVRVKGQFRYTCG